MIDGELRARLIGSMLRRWNDGEKSYSVTDLAKEMATSRSNVLTELYVLKRRWDEANHPIYRLTMGDNGDSS